MLQQSEKDHELPSTISGTGNRSSFMVAGPGSSLTIPGIITSEIVLALARLDSVSRIEVDLESDFAAGLFRAPSLAAAHTAHEGVNIVRLQAPSNSRLRMQSFRNWIGPGVHTAVAFAWPGIDNGWIKQFLHVAKVAKVSTAVMCMSLPESNQAKAITLADVMADADLVIVGDATDASELRSVFGSSGPRVETHRAGCLVGRASASSNYQITAFLPKDNVEIVGTLLAAFDAIPEAWIERYQLQIVMRFTGQGVPEMIAGSYHASHVKLIGEDISSLDLSQMCASSSALIVADPAFDSRAFSTAVGCGVATVVLAPASLPEVGRGYVGGLLADLNRPVSVHVALNHALRLADLQFPRPDAWDELARRLATLPGGTQPASGVFEPVNQI